MGKKNKNNKRGGSRFFRWIKSDLPDEEDRKSPVLLLGVNKIESPFVKRRSADGATTSGSIRFFRPTRSKYTRGLNGDERLEKIRKDLLNHKNGRELQYIPKDNRLYEDNERKIIRKKCLKLDCVSECVCKRKSSSNRGSFSFHRPSERQSSLCPSEPYGSSKSNDVSENDIEFKYKEFFERNHPSGSKQNSYNITPKSAERRSFLLSNLNERFRKTLSLDSRKVDTNCAPLSLPQDARPKSLVNTSNIVIKTDDPFVNSNFSKVNQPKKKRKSFFSLDTFFDSKKSDTSSIDDYCSSKYKRFELECDNSPLFRRDIREKTPDLLKLPCHVDSVRKKQSDAKRQLEKLENHYYRSLNKSEVSKTVIDAVPRDAKEIPGGHSNKLYLDDDVEYIEPFRSNFTSQSTLKLEKGIPFEKPGSILTINTDETDIRFPSSTVSPKSNCNDDLDFSSYEIEVKEADLLNVSKVLRVKVMDKSVDSIGSCSLDVDASTDVSDTTSGSLNLLTPSSTTSRIKDFTSRIQERAASNLHPSRQLSKTPTPTITPLPPTPTQETVKKSDNLLKPPPKVVINDSTSHRSRGHHKKREEYQYKKPSYLNLACSVNGYTNLTTYDSKLRQDINKSREASPIRPITHSYQYRSDTTSLLVPVPVSANKLLVPAFGPHDICTDLTVKAPPKAHTEPYLVTSPIHAFMASENKQLKNNFLGPSMTTASRPYMSTESKSFATSMLESDEVDNIKETFKSSYSESNFRKTTNNGQKSERLSSESYTISSNGYCKKVEITKENGETLTSPMKSFIQQRVERLYGPGALAQGFFNQKRHKVKSQSEDVVLSEKSLNCSSNKSFTPRKSYDNCEQENVYTSPNEPNVSLPVMRHLRPEFRAQLPILSPKKSPKAESPQKPVEDIPNLEKTEETTEIDVRQSEVSVTNGVSVINLNESIVSDVPESINGVEKLNGCSDVVKDGHYFLVLEKKETERLIALAASAERELESLQDNEEVSEEVLGFLRSASGKARLLATQKMQQFEGLCYNNINERADEPFPTTNEDLQGFWDMVCLQVTNVDALYQDIEELKKNGWKEITTPTKKTSSTTTQAPRSSIKLRTTPVNEKARLAAEKRAADRKQMLEQRRRVARERLLAAKSMMPGTSREHDMEMGIEGAQEVEIFVGKGAKPSKVAPKGDCRSATQSEDSFLES